MEKDFLVIGSVTYAMKGRDLLERYGLRASMRRVPKMFDMGCGYGLYVPGAADRAEELLRAYGIPVRGRAEWRSPQ